MGSMPYRDPRNDPAYRKIMRDHYHWLDRRARYLAALRGGKSHDEALEIARKQFDYEPSQA